MISADGRWVTTFNGEIYNHAAMRAELEAGGGGPKAAGIGWRGHSDTETLLECIAAWGLNRAIETSVGMFAIALWDRRERLLHLVRDRFGEKPLYYGWVGEKFVFASELKAIRALPGFDNPIDPRSVSSFAGLGYVPAPRSIYEHIYKLEPGCILSGGPAELRTPCEPGSEGEGLVRRYWSYPEIVAAGLESPIADEREALDRIEHALFEATKGQAVADVPVGAFLSGGIDSSMVVALYRRVSRVRTFTIGFEGRAFDEAPDARAVAEHLGTDHQESYVTAREAQQALTLMPLIYDEPFGDSSQIPTYLVCRHARQEVKVALSGDGGDELFGGYNRYLAAAGAWSRLRRLPAPARVAILGALGMVPPGMWNLAADLLGRRNRQPHFGEKVRTAMRTMADAGSADELYDSFVDQWYGQGSPVKGHDPGELSQPKLPVRSAPDAVQMMCRDAISYLPDDLLCKVDRAAMAVSLETRMPMLDHRLAELAARVPLGMKIAGGVGKLVLRKLLDRHLPRHLFQRPKTGFGVPVGEWLKGPLRPWAEELLDERRLREDGFFAAPLVRARWQEHLAGRRDSAAAIWYVLMFQAWLEQERGYQAFDSASARRLIA
jgi:asparagine synthase (glutamine-hydrolysing)